MMSLHWYELVNPLLDLGIVVHSFLFCLQQRSIFDLNNLVIRLSFAGLVSDISGADFVWVCHERCVVYLAAIRGLYSDSRLPAAPRFVPGATIETRLSKATQFCGEPLKNQQPKGLGVVRNNL